MTGRNVLKGKDSEIYLRFQKELLSVRSISNRKIRGNRLSLIIFPDESSVWIPSKFLHFNGENTPLKCNGGKVIYSIRWAESHLSKGVRTKLEAQIKK